MNERDKKILSPELLLSSKLFLNAGSVGRFSEIGLR